MQSFLNLSVARIRVDNPKNMIRICIIDLTDKNEKDCDLACMIKLNKGGKIKATSVHVTPPTKCFQIGTTNANPQDPKSNTAIPLKAILLKIFFQVCWLVRDIEPLFDSCGCGSQN